ncbi:tRNA pseudouridine(38-40) synthase TruA [Bifidobacterium sp.]|uniref:tRNA pseudouridine(38-40) synthase TruA n=1 Tax=Bifidobacterium sp. TaxID=41200 RepID=UPI0039E850FB
MWGVIRIRMDIAYDGTEFHGWAKQPGLRTVQGELEQALNTLLVRSFAKDQADRQVIHIAVAGRTDTGVHASHQVTHFDVQEEQLQRCVGYLDLDGIEALQHRLRRILPDDIAILGLERAPKGFDARFSALDRTYVFRIVDSECTPDPRLRNCVLAIEGHLDVAAMNQAAQCCVGLHDFGSFATPNPGGTTIRKVRLVEWQRISEASPNASEYRLTFPGMIVFKIVADAFAHNMVRSLVKACVSIGLGKRDARWFECKLNAPLREGSTGPIDPRGLTLERVEYPPDAQLAARAAKIRAKRTLLDD